MGISSEWLIAFFRNTCTMWSVGEIQAKYCVQKKKLNQASGLQISLMRMMRVEAVGEIFHHLGWKYNNNATTLDYHLFIFPTHAWCCCCLTGRAFSIHFFTLCALVEISDAAPLGACCSSDNAHDGDISQGLRRILACVHALISLDSLDDEDRLRRRRSWRS